MSSESCSRLFALPESDIPEPFDPSDPANYVRWQRHSSTYLPTGDGAGSSSRGGFVEYWVQENIAALPGLEYVNRVFAVLDRDAIARALTGIEAALGLIETLPRDLRGMWRSELTVADAMAASDEVLETQLPGDGDDPIYLILHLRKHRRVLGRALETHGFALYLLDSPYIDSEDASA